MLWISPVYNSLHAFSVQYSPFVTMPNTECSPPALQHAWRGSTLITVTVSCLWKGCRQESVNGFRRQTDRRQETATIYCTLEIVDCWTGWALLVIRDGMSDVFPSTMSGSTFQACSINSIEGQGQLNPFVQHSDWPLDSLDWSGRLSWANPV